MKVEIDIVGNIKGSPIEKNGDTSDNVCRDLQYECD